MRVPSKLDREPLVDCVFEVRFKSDIPAADVLPGIYFSHLDGSKKLDRLPPSEIPPTFRAANAELRYVGLSRIEWKDAYYITFGDYSLGVSAKMPYGGWASFQPAILQVLRGLQNIPLVTSIERCGFKTINLFEKDLGSVSEVVKLDISVGEQDLRSSQFHLRSESVSGDTTTIIQIATEAVTTFADGTTRSGALLDLDVVWNARDMERAKFLDVAEHKLRAMHLHNKNTFFGSITSQVLEKLGPRYDPD